MPPYVHEGVVYPTLIHANEAMDAAERREYEAMLRHDAAIDAATDRMVEEMAEKWRQGDFALYDRLRQVLTIDEMRTYLENRRSDDAANERLDRLCELHGELRVAYRRMNDRKNGEPGGDGFPYGELAPLGHASPEPPTPEGGWPIWGKEDYLAAKEARIYGSSSQFTREELQAWAAEHPNHPLNAEARIRELGFDPDKILLEQGVDLDTTPPIISTAGDYLEELMNRYGIEERLMDYWKEKEQEWQMMVEQERVAAE